MNKLVLALSSMLAMTMNFDLAAAEDLESVLQSKHRSDKSIARDQYRHPKQTIEFFGTKPTDHVLEMWPGTGWYSEILAPYVKEKGKFTAVTFALDNLYSDDKRDAYWSKTAIKYKEKMSDKALYGDITFNEFAPPQKFQCAEPNTIDVAYVVRTMHIWDEQGILLQGLESIHQALKPGGVLAVVQHRGTESTSIGSTAGEGYLDERYVVKVAKKAGFELVASSEINANALDTKDHPRGVYALPPTLAMGKKDKGKYQAIGESDRMTLKFVKVQ
jgi:predicted methyltransferase